MQANNLLSYIGIEHQLEIRLLSGEIGFTEFNEEILKARDKLGWDATMFSVFDDFCRYMHNHHPYEAETTINHEREHAKVYEGYGWVVRYGVIETEIRDCFGNEHAAFVAASPPPDFDRNSKLYKRINLEAARASQTGDPILDLDKRTAEVIASFL